MKHKKMIQTLLYEDTIVQNSDAILSFVKLLFGSLGTDKQVLDEIKLSCRYKHKKRTEMTVEPITFRTQLQHTQ